MICRFFLCLLIAYLAHIVSVSQFRAITAICRTLVLSNIAAFLLVMMAFLFGGVLIPKSESFPQSTITWGPATKSAIQGLINFMASLESVENVLLIACIISADYSSNILMQILAIICSQRHSWGAGDRRDIVLLDQASICSHDKLPNARLKPS